MKLNLPEYEHRIQNRKIFDIIRGKYVTLTPEEWVRQNFLRYLIEEKKTPKGLIRVEMTLILNDTVKRSDIVVHDKDGAPLLAVECKAPHISITTDTFDQIVRYNMVLKVPYLIVTNGLKHYCCKINDGGTTYEFIENLPEYTEL